MKKNVFTTCFRVFTPLILAIATLAPKKPGQIAIVILFCLWGLVLFVYALHCINRNLKRTPRRHKARPFERLHNTEVKVLSPKREKGITLSSEDVQFLMTQFRLRISEKLKSAYPEAIWKWANVPSLKELIGGNTVRIQVEHMGQYTHADVCFDGYGRIHVEPMTIGSFIPEDHKKSGRDDESPKEPAVVDVKAWFDMIGKMVIDKQITELNAQGHSKLTIKENGDIVVGCNHKEKLLCTLDAFPEKNYWEELRNVLTDNGLDSKIAGNSLQISWV